MRAQQRGLKALTTCFWLPLALFAGVATCCRDASGSGYSIRMEFLDHASGGVVIRPCISVDESGAVTYCDPVTGEGRAQVSEDQLSSLFVELTETLDVDSIDSTLLWDEIVAEGRRTGLSPMINGAGITRISLTIPGEDDSDGREVVVECPACHLLAVRYPAVESLQRFAQCQELLENLRAVLQLGGFDEAERVADLANSHLDSLGAEHERLTCRDVCFVRGLPDGALCVMFQSATPPICTVSATLEPGRTPVFQVLE